jgi:hypothetical protein
MKKNIKFSLFLIPLFLLAYHVGPTFVYADDDEKQEENEGIDDNEDAEDSAPAAVVEVPSIKSSTTSQPKTTYTTITDPPTYVTEIKTETVVKKDSDRDGLIDEVDPNPNIPEYYIVQDVNNNGINDLFEYGN